MKWLRLMLRHPKCGMPAPVRDISRDAENNLLLAAFCVFCQEVVVERTTAERLFGTLITPNALRDMPCPGGVM